MSQHPARDLAGALEPFAGQVYFSQECHQNYEELGFSASPGDMNGVALPDGPAYFCSRGSVMGQVPGELVASAFAVFNPAVVVPAVTYGWTLTDAATICAARTDGAVGALARILGDEPDGLDRAIELLHAGDRRTCAPRAGRSTPGSRRSGCPARRWATPGAWPTSCASTGATPTPRRGPPPASTPPRSACSASSTGASPMRTYVRSRAWSDAELDAAEARLEDRGLMADHQLTDRGAGGARAGGGRHRRAVRGDRRRAGRRPRRAPRAPPALGRRHPRRPAATRPSARTTWPVSPADHEPLRKLSHRVRTFVPCRLLGKSSV